MFKDRFVSYTRRARVERIKLVNTALKITVCALAALFVILSVALFVDLLGMKIKYTLEAGDPLPSAEELSGRAGAEYDFGNYSSDFTKTGEYTIHHEPIVCADLNAGVFQYVSHGTCLGNGMGKPLVFRGERAQSRLDLGIGLARAHVKIMSVVCHAAERIKRLVFLMILFLDPHAVGERANRHKNTPFSALIIHAREEKRNGKSKST